MIESFGIDEIIIKTKLTGNRKILLGIIDYFTTPDNLFYGNSNFIASLMEKTSNAVSISIYKLKQEGILKEVVGKSNLKAMCINFEHPMFILKSEQK